MNNFDFNIEGLLGKLDHISQISLDKAIDKACFIVENAAKDAAPVDTGILRRSITHEVEDGVGYIGTNVEYAPYIEFGTGVFAAAGDGRKQRWSYQTADGQWHSTIGQHPQPFLQPALDNNRIQVLEAIRDYYKEEIANA
jgi:HK97 gp10 family phage protein